MYDSGACGRPRHTCPRGPFQYRAEQGRGRAGHVLGDGTGGGAPERGSRHRVCHTAQAAGGLGTGLRLTPGPVIADVKDVQDPCGMAVAHGRSTCKARPAAGRVSARPLGCTVRQARWYGCRVKWCAGRVDSRPDHAADTLGHGRGPGTRDPPSRTGSGSELLPLLSRRLAGGRLPVSAGAAGQARPATRAAGSGRTCGALGGSARAA